MIFFDIDGTLIDHKKAEKLGVNGFYSKYKEYFDITEELFYLEWCKISDIHFRRFLNGELSFSQQRIERIKDVFKIFDKDISNDDALEKFKDYINLYEKNLQPFDDVIESLNLIKGHRLGIISNGDLNQQLMKIEKINSKIPFEVIITAGDVGVSKPNIEIFKIACQRANVDIKNCFYVGDDVENDMIPCVKAGMTGIWIDRTSDGREYKDFRKIKDLKEISGFLSKK